MAIAPKTFRRNTSAPQKRDHRPSAAQRGYPASKKWHNSLARKTAIARDKGLCVKCRAEGTVTPFDVVDHMIPVHVRPDLRLALPNLQCLCRSCHKQKTDADLKKYGAPNH